MSSPPASSLTPVVGGTSVLSGAGYSNFASIREAQLAQFQEQQFNELNGDTSDEEDKKKRRKKHKKKRRKKHMSLPAPLSHRSNLDYTPYYTKAYYNTYETFAMKEEKEDNKEKDVGVFSPYGGIPEPPNKKFEYYKTVMTPNDELLYVYKNRKTGDLVEFNSKSMKKKCNKRCPKYFSPVCGTDNITYDNQCELNKMVCKSGGKVGFKHPGYCQNGINHKQFIDYKGNGYNLVNSSYVTNNDKRYVYVIDDNLNTAITKVNV